MKKIYKYIHDKNEFISLPGGAIFRKLGVQEGKLCLWFEIDTQIDQYQNRKFTIVGTGQCIPPNYNYIDTFFNAEFVWHVHEVIL